MRLTPKTVGDVLEATLGYRVEMNPYGFELQNTIPARARLQRGSGIADRGNVWTLVRLPDGAAIVTGIATKAKLVSAVLAFTTPTIESISLDQLKTDKELAAKAARQPGGVRVVDARGIYVFRLSIPSTPLPDDTTYEDAIRVLAREVIRSADDDDDYLDNTVGADAHALRVLIEGRLVDDIAEAVRSLRGAKP